VDRFPGLRIACRNAFTTRFWPEEGTSWPIRILGCPSVKCRRFNCKEKPEEERLVVKLGRKRRKKITPKVQFQTGRIGPISDRSPHQKLLGKWMEIGRSLRCHVKAGVKAI